MSYGTPPPPAQWGAPSPFGGIPQPHPKGTQILIFGILGLVCCMPFGIAAWVMSVTALGEIDQNPAAYNNRGTIVAGKVCGIISVVMFALGLVAYIAIAGLAVSSNSISNY